MLLGSTDQTIPSIALEPLLQPKEVLLARKQALSKQILQETTVSLYRDNSNPLLPKQYEIVSFVDEHQLVRIFAIDKSAKLGEGAQGEVYLAQELLEEKKFSLTTPPLSIVKITSNEMHFDDYQNEYEILNHIHRHAKRCLHEMGNAKTIYLFSPFYPGINLQNICYYNFNGQLVKKPLNELLLIKLFQGILSQVQQLHQNDGVLHRDLKLNNFLVDINNDEVKVTLIDFGTSCLIQKSNKSFSGTIGYQAPDLTLSPNQHGIYNLQHEYYSVGVILAELIANENYHRYVESKMHDFASSNFLETIQKSDLKTNLTSVFIHNTNERYPAFASFVEMIRSLTKKDPFKRPTYQDIDKMIKRLTTMEQDYCLLPDSPKSESATPRERASSQDLSIRFTGFKKEELTRQLEALTSELKSIKFDDSPSSSIDSMQIHFALSFSSSVLANTSTSSTTRARSQTEIPPLNLESIPQNSERMAKSGSKRKKMEEPDNEHLTWQAFLAEEHKEKKEKRKHKKLSRPH